MFATPDPRAGTNEILTSFPWDLVSVKGSPTGPVLRLSEDVFSYQYYENGGKTWSSKAPTTGRGVGLPFTTPLKHLDQESAGGGCATDTDYTPRTIPSDPLTIECDEAAYGLPY